MDGPGPDPVRRWFTFTADDPVVPWAAAKAAAGWVPADGRGPVEIDEGLWAWCFEWNGDGPAPPVTAG